MGVAEALLYSRTARLQPLSLRVYSCVLCVYTIGEDLWWSGCRATES